MPVRNQKGRISTSKCKHLKLYNFKTLKSLGQIAKLSISNVKTANLLCFYDPIVPLCVNSVEHGDGEQQVAPSEV